MNLLLWILQVLWALVFVGSGATKIVQDRQRFVHAAHMSRRCRTGNSRPSAHSNSGGLGLVLPAASGIAPVLTPLAALGLAIVMVGAMALHTRRREPQGVVVTGVLFAVAVVIAWARFGPYPV